MESSTRAFKENARTALADPQLKRALAHVKVGFIAKRAKAAAKLPEFEALRDQSRDIKDHTLAHLDLYLERYETKLTEAGGQVHWCATAADATRKLQERVSQRQDQMDEEIDRENENLEEEESAIDADPSLTPAQKQTRKEDARDKHRGRVDVIKKKTDDANDKDRRDTEKDIETLGEHSPLGDLKALIIPAAALIVGGLVITKL